MRRVVVLALVGLTGCLFHNEITGDWSLGGQGGCVIGQDVYVEVPDYDGPIVADRFPCARGRFAIDVPADMHDFRVELWVEDPSDANVGHAEASLRDVIDDFNIGHVYFETIP